MASFKSSTNFILSRSLRAQKVPSVLEFASLSWMPNWQTTQQPIASDWTDRLVTLIQIYWNYWNKLKWKNDVMQLI